MLKNDSFSSKMIIFQHFVVNACLFMQLQYFNMYMYIVTT